MLEGNSMCKITTGANPALPGPILLPTEEVHEVKSPLLRCVRVHVKNKSFMEVLIESAIFMVSMLPGSRLPAALHLLPSMRHPPLLRLLIRCRRQLLHTGTQRQHSKPVVVVVECTNWVWDRELGRRGHRCWG